MSIVDELAHLFTETLIAQPGTVDREGTFTPVGAAVSVPARFEGNVRVVRGNGQEVVSSLSAIVAGTPGFSPHGYRYTIPSRFTPNSNLIAIQVVHESDADGPVYEEVLFP